MPRCRSGTLSGYGDWTGRRRARWCRPVAESAADMVSMRDGDDAMPVSGMRGGREVRFWPRKAKPSAIGSGRRKADVVLMQPVLVLMLRLATPVGHEWFPRERRSR
jgi:hypothetical protein